MDFITLANKNEYSYVKHKTIITFTNIQKYDCKMSNQLCLHYESSYQCMNRFCSSLVTNQLQKPYYRVESFKGEDFRESMTWYLDIIQRVFSKKFVSIVCADATVQVISADHS